LFPNYDTLAGQMTRQAVDAVLRAVNIRPSAKLLDVATGPGYVAAEAQRRGADPLGVDFSSDMIEVAAGIFRTSKSSSVMRKIFATPMQASIQSSVRSACCISLDRIKALREAYRVLRSGGCCAFTVRCGPAKNKFFGTIADVIVTYADPAVELPRVQANSC
jgi:ubiquinone/menaquinone biosynthesis C-methylase UbiE